MDFELSTEEQVFEYFSEFKATKNSIQRDVKYLKEWMKQEPHLPEVDDDDLIRNFLLRGKNNVEKTKRLIDTYFTARARMPEIFRNRGPEFIKKIDHIRKFALFFPVPKLTTDGHRLIIFYVCEHSNEDQLPNAIDMLKTAQTVFDLSLKLDKVRGVTMIYDFQHVGMAFFKSFFAALRIALTIQSKINPIRYNRIYILNMPTFAQPIVTFATNFIKKQNEKLVFWTKESKELSDVLPKSCLPMEYGGILPPLSDIFDVYLNYAMNYAEWLPTQDDVVADLSKKNAGLTNDDTFRGIDGTFRKLSID